MQTQPWDVIIVGGGAAGLSAALMLGRARRTVLVVDAGQPRNRFAAHMHGVLGNENTPPGELIARGREEAAGYGVEFADTTVDRVDDDGELLRVTAADGQIRQARSLIVATGLADDLPPIPGLAERWGKSVLHCPYCHGWEVRDQHLGVLTTSPFGLHQSELVRQWSDRITVFTEGLGELSPEAERRLRARDIELVPGEVAEIIGDGDTITAVKLQDGRSVEVDAIFTIGAARPLDAFLTPLQLERTEGPFGSFLTVDGTGKTSHDRVWAIGNVVNPGANVPISIGAGALTGGVVNAALVAWEFDAALSEPATSEPIDPVAHWEDHYTAAERVWSGRVNHVLGDVAADLQPGRALDLGCGEGADVIWLAEHGWEATGIDISATAIARAVETAQSSGIDADRVTFEQADLSSFIQEAGDFELVTASFFHSPVELPRADILRQAAGRVTPGGHLLITSHAGPPPWSTMAHDHHSKHLFLSPTEELEQLNLEPESWEILLAEKRPRETVGPDGKPATLDDVVVLARRR